MVNLFLGDIKKMSDFVAAIAFKNNSFLLVNHKKRGWEFPGGKIRENEGPKDAVKREFLEETGYKLEKVKLVEEKNSGFFYKGKVGDQLGANEEFGIEFFEELPRKLSFERSGYEEILEAAKRY
ncbi:NUDIX hydrolase [archaeon SCG-AAA382B04]|nr:NUDIX hydrolase [archaeon SCG-AAA382B04]